MWLLTNFGFFSIVEKPDDKNTGMLTIRARVKADLETLRERYLPELGEIVAGAGTDYKYRAKVSRNALANAAARIVQGIEYGNFKDSVKKQQGSDRAHVYSSVWDILFGLQDKPAKPASKKLATMGTPIVPKTSYGGVLFDAKGRVLLREPAGHFDGYVWTFPKGRPEDAKTGEDAALREVLEETGYHAEVVARIPGEFKGGTGSNIYFLMKPIGKPIKHDTETQSIRWSTPEEAAALIQQTTNPTGRKRDLAVLQAAVAEHQEQQSK